MSLSSLLAEVSLLSDHDIKKLIEEGKLQIDPYDPGSINPISIDLRLGSVLVQYPSQTIKIGKNKPLSCEQDITGSTYILHPGEFILGTTKERVCIPNGYLGVIETKGDIARAGIQVNNSAKIQVHNNDGHIDPGFCGHITLEIKNMNSNEVCVELVPDVLICQLFIGKLSSLCDSPYNGKYLNQIKPTTYCP